MYQPVELFFHIFQTGQDIDITCGSIGILQIPDFLDPKCETEKRHGSLNWCTGKSGQSKWESGDPVRGVRDYNKNLIGHKKPGARYQHPGIRVEINNKEPNLCPKLTCMAGASQNL